MSQRLPRLALCSALVLPALTCSASCARGVEPSLVVWAENGGTPFIFDGSTLVTVSPNADGYRDTVVIHYSVSADSVVRFDVARRGTAKRIIASEKVAAGEHVFGWCPPARPVPAAYLLHVSAGAASTMVVVHVQGIDAAAARAAYHPGDVVRVAVSTDARGLRVDVIGITGAAPTTRRNDKVQGTPMGPAFHLAWPGHGDRPHALAVRLGHWRSGVYFVRLRADDGRIGYAPFVLRPHRLGRSRVAVVMPTNTWQAYNFYDRDGDGHGDTWYAGWRRHTMRMGRPYLNRGVPAHFNTYDLPFLRWTARTELRADYLSDADLGSIGSGDLLARLYDFVVFPGHQEYVTRSEYDTVRRFRDLGGNLAWLSANNFFWKVVRHGPLVERVARWRSLGRPEASLIGVQYSGSDEGQRRAPMVVTDAVPWLFGGTRLARGDTFGRFGIEIDARAPSSPQGTTVLAHAPDLFGGGTDAEMTYYELSNGAKVFAAGAFSLAGLADSRIGAQMLDNLFARLEKP
jgi:N,N-dimethylformamidase beta subunit-like protein